MNTVLSLDRRLPSRMILKRRIAMKTHGLRLEVIRMYGVGRIGTYITITKRCSILLHLFCVEKREEGEKYSLPGIRREAAYCGISLNEK